MPLDPSKVPVAIVSLLPLAERWGIGDDYDREAAVASASREELERLIHSIDDVELELYEWLEGPEASNRMPSDEYAAFTCLTMAIDSARSELRQR